MAIRVLVSRPAVPGRHRGNRGYASEVSSAIVILGTRRTTPTVYEVGRYLAVHFETLGAILCMYIRRGRV